MFKLTGYDAARFTVGKLGDDLTNEIGKLLYFPENEAYALVVGTEAAKTAYPIADVVDSNNEEDLSRYIPMGFNRVRYSCQWAFYRKGGMLMPGYPSTLPSMLSDAEVLSEPINFEHLIRFYTPTVVENGILDKHLEYLLDLNPQPLGAYLTAYILEAATHAIKNQNALAISFLDSILTNQQVFNLLKDHLEANPMSGKVTSVADGLIHTSEFTMPGVGDLYKFEVANGRLFTNVQSLSFTFNNLNVGPNLIWFLRQTIIPKQVSYRPLASQNAGTTKDGKPFKPVASIRSYPDYGATPEPMDANDIQVIFPGEGVVGAYNGHTIHFDIDTFIQRSCGVFGKSGTGKSTFTRLVALQMVKHRQTILIMDEHNEFAKTHLAYGKAMYGLQDVFPERVRTVSFGTKPIFSTPDGNPHQADLAVQIPVDMITVEDLLQVSGALNLSKGAEKVLTAVNRKLQKEWKGKYGGLVDAILFMKQSDFKAITGKKSDEDEEYGEAVEVDDDESGGITVNEMSLAAVRSSLAAWFLQDEKNYRDYFCKTPPGGKKNTVGEIINWLKSGQSVVINTPKKAYILIANIIFRMVMQEWQKNPDRHLTIFVEEAHALIPPNNETLAGKVAREMRKYETTLVIIDQTPDKIDQEVVRQLGTYAVFPLSTYEEARCVLPQGTPVPEVMSRLGASQEAYLWGSTFLLPVFVQIADYSMFAESVLKEVKEEQEKKGKDPLGKFYKSEVSL